jgi:hypothetical protein
MSYRSLSRFALSLCFGALAALSGGLAELSLASPSGQRISAAQRKLTPTPTPTATAAPTTSTTFVKIYKDIVNNVQSELTPEDVQVTADGGYILLGLAAAPQNGVGVSWLVKTDAAGNAQWQEEVGCFSTPPGDYADGVSAQQTSDGGYVVAGGTVGCGSTSVCPSTSGIQCAMVEKLDKLGNVSWSNVYLAGEGGSAITQIKQTSDGGYIAVGSATNNSQSTGALALKLDGVGNLQWERQLGPSSSTFAYLKAVQQTSDGGFVATGEFLTPTSGASPTNVLAIKFDASGAIQWQQGFGVLSSTGSIAGTEHAQSIVQASDGGYVVGGNWTNSTFPGQCCAGALLLKLNATGTMQWQFAYSGGVICSYQSCTDVTGIIYSLHQSTDGGYIVAGAYDHPSLVPWLARVDSAGNLVWQHLYYEVNPSTGLPLSEYFGASTLTTGGGALGLGWTEDPATLKGDLFGVSTDNAGLVASCADVHAPTPISAINPGLSPVAPALPVQTTLAPIGQGSTTQLPTSIAVQTRC